MFFQRPSAGQVPAICDHLGKQYDIVWPWWFHPKLAAPTIVTIPVPDFPTFQRGDQHPSAPPEVLASWCWAWGGTIRMGAITSSTQSSPSIPNDILVAPGLLVIPNQNHLVFPTIYMERYIFPAQTQRRFVPSKTLRRRKRLRYDASRAFWSPSWKL